MCQYHANALDKSETQFKHNTVCESKVDLVYVCDYLKHAVKVLHFQVRWELELVADVITTFASVWHVDCEHQGLVAERLHSVHKLL